MSWTSRTLRGQETFDQCVARLRKGDTVGPTAAADRVELLEDDLARALLVIHTLTEACIQRGVFTREELHQMAAEVDMFDGVADGKLDPAVIRPQPQSPP